jgi:DNA polymerase V
MPLVPVVELQCELLDIAFHINGDLSARVMRVLADFTPDLEFYSIDEAFLDLGGFEHRLEAHARELRARVMQWTGIPVSVGIAATKTLAKVANHRAKKDPACQGVCVMLDDAAIDAELARLPLTDIWGIAGRLGRRLADIGITTPLALKQADARFIRERFSVTLERTALELRGMPCIALEDAPASRKSVMASRSFGRLVTARREMEEAVASYAARAAAKISPSAGSWCSCRPTLSALRMCNMPASRRFGSRLRPPIPARSCAPPGSASTPSGATDFSIRRRA